MNARANVLHVRVRFAAHINRACVKHEMLHPLGHGGQGHLAAARELVTEVTWGQSLGDNV